MLGKTSFIMLALMGTLTIPAVNLVAVDEVVKEKGPQLLEVKEKAFSLEVPNDWLKDKVREGLDLFVYAPVPASDKIALTNMGVVAGKVNKELSLSNFYKANVENLPVAFDNYVEISKGTGGIPNIPTNWIIFKRKLSTEAGEITLEELQYYLIAGNFGYVITFSATPNEFVENRGIFEKIIQTFKVLEPSEQSLDILQVMPGSSSGAAAPATAEPPK
jgi:hypothetical protein